MKKNEKEDLSKIHETVGAWITQNKETWSIVKNRVYSHQFGLIGSMLDESEDISKEELENMILMIAKRNLKSIWDKVFLVYENRYLSFNDICLKFGITYETQRTTNAHDMAQIDLVVKFDINEIKKIFKK